MTVLIISQSLTLGLEQGAQPLTHARIGWHTYHRNSVWSSTSSVADFEPSALRNDMTLRRWQPSSVPASATADIGAQKLIDYIGIAAHTFKDNSNSFKVQASTDGVTFFDITTDYAPGNNDPIMILIEPVTVRHIRLSILSGAAPTVGVMYFGEVLEMERSVYGGHSPIHLSRKSSTIPRVSESGQWLSKTRVRQGYSSSIEWANLTASWYRLKFDPFVASAELHPYFIAWNPLRAPGEVGYCWTDDDIQPANSGKRNFMTVSMSMVGYRG